MKKIKENRERIRSGKERRAHRLPDIEKYTVATEVSSR